MAAGHGREPSTGENKGAAGPLDANWRVQNDELIPGALASDQLV